MTWCRSILTGVSEYKYIEEGAGKLEKRMKKVVDLKTQSLVLAWFGYQF
jgi:hypothetical protein